MSDQAQDKPQAPDNTLPGGGQQPAGQDARTFTQQDIDRVVSERLARQKAQFADYDELKTKASKLAEIEEAQKTETQKLAERAAAAEAARDEALARAQDMLIRSAFVAEGARLQVAHPEDVYALADLAGVSVDEAGRVTGVAEAVKAIVDANRIPLANRPQAPKLDGGAGRAQKPEDLPALNEVELAIARKMNVPPEKYAAEKRAIAQRAQER